jgi:hypothetical protein
LSIKCDDGIVAYVNGVEIGRINVGPGAATHATYASASFTTDRQALTLRPLTIPPGVLVGGTNVLAIMLKQGTPVSVDLLLDARLTYYALPIPTLAP